MQTAIPDIWHDVTRLSGHLVLRQYRAYDSEGTWLDLTALSMGVNPSRKPLTIVFSLSTDGTRFSFRTSCSARSIRGLVLGDGL